MSISPHQTENLNKRDAELETHTLSTAGVTWTQTTGTFAYETETHTCVVWFWSSSPVGRAGVCGVIPPRHLRTCCARSGSPDVTNEHGPEKQLDRSNLVSYWQRWHTLSSTLAAPFSRVWRAHSPAFHSFPAPVKVEPVHCYSEEFRCLHPKHLPVETWTALCMSSKEHWTETVKAAEPLNGPSMTRYCNLAKVRL